MTILSTELGFILTMRNVNEVELSKDIFNIECFILTMRNVNSTFAMIKKLIESGFILTMRNVNNCNARW